MKANELRIGNFIQANGPMMEVRAIYEDHIELYLHGSEADNWDEDLDVCEGVPLTPEILENCGFVSNKRCWYKEFFRGNDTLRSYVFVGKLPDDPEGMYYFGFESPMSGVNINNIYHLHQLQNIYYALTGIELQFTHPKQTQV